MVRCTKSHAWYYVLRVMVLCIRSMVLCIRVSACTILIKTFLQKCILNAETVFMDFSVELNKDSVEKNFRHTA